MKIAYFSSIPMVVAVLALAGCGSTDGGGGGFVNASDATGGDTAVADAAPDDAVTADSGAGDAGQKDAAAVDVAVADSGPLDTGPADTGPADTGPADTGANCSKTDYTKVQAIFTQNCNGCHGHQFGTSCSYATSEKSQIKSKVSGGSMPPGGFSNSADKALVLKWMSDGAACSPVAGCP